PFLAAVSNRFLARRVDHRRSRGLYGRRSPSAAMTSPLTAPRCLLFLVGALCSCSPMSQGQRSRLNGASFSALIFSKTAGFRHASIPNGIQAISELAAQNGFNADASEDSGLFSDKVLANYTVVIFLSTTGTILDDEQKAAFQRFIEGGKGFVGIHSATDTEYDWPWYGQLV